MRYAFLAFVCVGAFSVASAASSGTEPASTLSTPANIDISFPVSNDEPRIEFRSVKGAAYYHLAATFLVVRINASDAFCTPPLLEESRTIAVNEQLSPEATSFDIPLPSLPPREQWFFANSNVTLEAFDESGVLLATGGGGGIGETNALCPTKTPGLVLPGAGSGADKDDASAPLVNLLAAGLAAAGMGLLAAGRAKPRDSSRGGPP